LSDRPTSDLTRILRTVTERGADAVQLLLPAVYEELRVVAEQYLRFERPGMTLSATALVHEVYLKLIEQQGVRWQNRAHFLAVAAQAMRRILVDRARSRGREKRGGGWQCIPLSAVDPQIPLKDLDLLALEEALERLSSEEPLEAKIVEMRFFGGMQTHEIAEVLDIADRTVRRRLAYAKAWLFRELTKGDTGPHRSGGYGR
jgi:RNA polymerase sigma factor (TIGR02999 family)